MTSTTTISLWDASAQERDVAADREVGGTVDVVAVGGGFTGLSTALYCAEAGLSAWVLEAHRIGHGGSGRNVGLVNAGIWLPPREVREALGPDYGPRFLRRFADGPRQVFDLVEKHQIRCEATRTGTLHAAHAPSGFENLKGRWEEWNAMGEPVDLLDPEEAAERIGSDAFHGALLDHRAGTINPMSYCRGLARAAIGAGARITTGVTVTGLEREGDAWRVKTDAGHLTARAVVLGTNAYTDDLWPGLKRTFTTIHYFNLATAPLGERAAPILPERQGLWTTAPIMTSLRKDAGGRLVIGSMGRVIGGAARGVSRRWAARQLARLFPGLGPVAFEDAWDGRIAKTPDHLPRLHVLADGLYTPIGYNGRGITTGTIFGEAMAGLLTGMDPGQLPLPVTPVAKVRSAPVMSRLYSAAFAGKQLMSSLGR